MKGADSSDRRAGGELQERAHMVMTLFSVGHMLVANDACRIVWKLSVNGTVPIIQQYQVRAPLRGRERPSARYAVPLRRFCD